MNNLREIQREVFQIGKAGLGSRCVAILDEMAGEERNIHQFISGETESANVGGEFQAGNVRKTKSVKIEDRQRGHLRRCYRCAQQGKAGVRNRHGQTESLADGKSQAVFMEVAVDWRIQGLELGLTESDGFGL